MEQPPKKVDIAKELKEQTKATADKAVGMAKGLFNRYKDVLKKGQGQPKDSGEDKK